MKTYACINQDTNIVENVIVWDGITEYTPEEGHYLVEIPVGVDGGIECIYQNGEFIRPTPPDEPTP